MPMAYSWFRVYTGTVNDKKWPRIARDAGQPVGCVVSVWLALLESASSNIDRGAVDDFCPEDIDALYGYDDGTTESIVHAMRDRGLISPENRLTAWDKRQNIPTEDAPEDRRAYKREWARRKREESRMADSPASGQPVDSCGHDVDTSGRPVDSCGHDVDTSGQPVDSCGHHREKIREDKIRDLKDTPLTPQGETGVGEAPSPKTSSPKEETPKTGEEPQAEEPAQDVKPNLTHGNPAWKEFCYLYSLWPVQQGRERAWREYAALKARHLVPESYVLAEVIDRFKVEDRKWKRGYTPLMANWLRDRRWDDQPDKAPAPSYAPDENGRTRYVNENEQDYSRSYSGDLVAAL